MKKEKQKKEPTLLQQRIPFIAGAAVFVTSAFENFMDLDAPVLGAVYLVFTGVTIYLIRNVEKITAVVHLVFNNLVALSCIIVAFQKKAAGSERLPIIYFALAIAYVALSIKFYREYKPEE